tara:strand:- start:402 stop:986 length:585 start_codon:yes stop_codon:yes gene_type:complete
MAFIDELIREGGLPYGMKIEEEPKAHDEIDSLIDNNLQKDLINLVMGTVGGGGGIITKIKARNAKAIRNLTSGELKGQQTLKPEDAKWLSDQWRNWEGLTKEISGTKNPEMKKYLGRLREELDPNYSGPSGGWHQGRFNLNYDPPSGGEVGALLGSLISMMGLVQGISEEDRQGRVYGQFQGESPNIGRTSKQY